MKHIELNAHTYSEKFIFSKIYNRFWRWQYCTRRAIARKVRMFFYAFTHKGLSL